ncbi:NAD(P)-binding protein [Jackrogersella minutella]|nr:NAD(P)-binding protein [Jackrogersella minutella]
MKVARVTAWGQPPQYITHGPSLPDPSPSQVQLKVLAVGVPRIVRSSTGNKYYIVPGAVPLLAERANVELNQMLQLAPEADPITVAALINPVSSSWMALKVRVIGGCRGRAVFILGATTESGRRAIHIAHELGAAKIVGASRNKETLDQVEGLDERVLLDDRLNLPKTVGPLDIVLDFVGGPIAAALMHAAEIREGLHLLNARLIRIMESGMSAFSMLEIKKEITGPVNIVTAALADVETVWDSVAEKKRLVLIP